MQALCLTVLGTQAHRHRDAHLATEYFEGGIQTFYTIVMVFVYVSQACPNLVGSATRAAVPEVDACL